MYDKCIVSTAISNSHLLKDLRIKPSFSFNTNVLLAHASETSDKFRMRKLKIGP